MYVQRRNISKLVRNIESRNTRLKKRTRETKDDLKDESEKGYK